MDYEKASETKASSGRKPYIEGDIDAKFVVIKSEASEGHRGNNYIVELRVLSARATAPDAQVPPVGAERVVIIDLDNKDYGYPNLMAYVAGLNDGPIQGATKEEKGKKLKKLLGSEGVEAFAVGMLIGNRPNKGKTKQKGTDFTYHNWYFVQQTLDEINQRKQMLKDGKEITLSVGNVE